MNLDYTILLYIFFGVLPSLVWLFYYLAKDKHPEPKKAILRIFLWGMLATIPVFFIQFGLSILLNNSGIDANSLTYNLIKWFLIIALTEELFKYLVVKTKGLTGSDIDEPFDLMLYMVVAALGFAAFENVMYLFKSSNTLLSLDRLVETTVLLSLVRFIGATFLHTLCSAVVGYFLAFEMKNPQKKFYSTEVGLLFAIGLHGVYDLLIMKLEDYQTLLSISIILLTFGFLTFVGFEKLKKMPGVTMVEIPKEAE